MGVKHKKANPTGLASCRSRKEHSPLLLFVLAWRLPSSFGFSLLRLPVLLGLSFSRFPFFLGLDLLTFLLSLGQIFLPSGPDNLQWRKGKFDVANWSFGLSR